MPDPPYESLCGAQPPKSSNGLTCHDGGRDDLEWELVALYFADKAESERARALRELLTQRGELNAAS
jgi:hypothetical protein